MAVSVKRLDVQIGDLVEIGGRRYDVVSDKSGGVALEPAIMGTVADIHAEHRGHPVTQEEFDEFFGDLPEKLSQIVAETDGQVFHDEEFIAHLERLEAAEDELPRDKRR